jgi:hypothetical protein
MWRTKLPVRQKSKVSVMLATALPETLKNHFHTSPVTFVSSLNIICHRKGFGSQCWQQSWCRVSCEEYNGPFLYSVALKKAASKILSDIITVPAKSSQPHLLIYLHNNNYSLRNY